jgi:peptide-methionine (S)-S-oxide reductase
MKRNAVTMALWAAVLGGLIVMSDSSEAREGITEQATLGGGCFWCVEAVYEELAGVISAVSGYAGGRAANPDYREVCTGSTGHAEVVQITFDPEVISYAEILGVFFTSHDPTTLNRQGADVGTQYRSVIYTHSDEQRKIAEAAVRAVNESGAWPNRVVTEITALPKFYKAEDYHQDYYANNRTQGYCQAVINPKLAKLRKDWADKLK